MFLVLMGLLYFQAEAISTNPCNICASKMGEEVSCKVGDVYISENVYHVNGSIERIRPNILKKDYSDIANWTVVQE